MNDRAVSRRGVLAGGLAASAAIAGGWPTGQAVAAHPDLRSGPDPEPVFQGQAVVSAVPAGEQVLYVAAAAMTPNASAAGTTSVIRTIGVYPSGTVATTYVSASINVPLGSTLTNIEWVVNGTTHSGRVALLKYIPAASTAFTTLAAVDLPAASGIVVYSSAIPAAGAAEVFDGTQTYEAYYRLNSAGVTTSEIMGVRVRYRPPGNALVPVTPARAYDSRLNMAPDANGALASGSNRTVSVANARNVDTGAVTGALVPSNATAIAYTLTTAGTTGAGFLAVNPGGTTAVTASAINWTTTGLSIANTGVVKLGPGSTITVVAGGAGSTDFIVDIVGYYL